MDFTLSIQATELVTAIVTALLGYVRLFGGLEVTYLCYAAKVMLVPRVAALTYT